MHPNSTRNSARLDDNGGIKERNRCVSYSNIHFELNIVLFNVLKIVLEWLGMVFFFSRRAILDQADQASPLRLVFTM